ncbi:MAG: DUF5693 family protein [Candidatus Eremiobacteraeota bacterium]|nr:DUF5693 family protein [Candidatus Eremiobacteraeota bacterium]
MKPAEKLLWVMVVLSIIAALAVAAQRLSLESGGRNVELVVDYNAIQDISLIEGTPEEDLVKHFLAAGITGLALSEDTLESLKARGKARWYVGGDLISAFRAGIEKTPKALAGRDYPPVSPTKLYVTVYDQATRDQLLAFLPVFCSREKVREWPADSPSAEVSPQAPAVIELTGQEKTLTVMGLGFSKEKAKKYLDMGLSITLRPENKLMVTPAMIEGYRHALEPFQPIHTVIFSGLNNDVLGFPECLPESAAFIQGLGCHLGIIEAPNVKAMQKGIQTLGVKCTASVLRVQSVSPLFQEKLTMNDLVDKFELGVRERNIRMIYLRPHMILTEGRSLSETNEYYFSRLSDTLRKRGFTLGAARAFPLFTPHPLLIALLSLGAAAAALLLLRKVITLPDPLTLALLGIFVLAGAAFFTTGHMALWRKLMALGAGLVFPTLAMIIHMDLFQRSLRENTYLALLGSATVALMRITMMTFLGALVMAGLLSSTEFFLQVDRFRGIKLLMVLPPLFVTLYYIMKASPKPLKAGDLLGAPVKALHLLALCILGGAGAYYIIRTGNTTEAAASDIELAVRSFLNQVLLVRPRFKEFLLGYPGLMLIPGFIAFGAEYAVWLLMLIAGIGQADICDTFAHLHTPLAVSLIRAAYGLILGWIAGAAALFIFFKGVQLKGKMSQERSSQEAP